MRICFGIVVGIVVILRRGKIETRSRRSLGNKATGVNLSEYLLHDVETIAQTTQDDTIWEVVRLDVVFPDVETQTDTMLPGYRIFGGGILGDSIGRFRICNMGGNVDVEKTEGRSCSKRKERLGRVNL